MSYTHTFFETLERAEHFAKHSQRGKVTDVLGMDKPGTVKRFKQELAEHEFYADREFPQYRACVLIYR